MPFLSISIDFKKQTPSAEPLSCCSPEKPKSVPGILICWHLRFSCCRRIPSSCLSCLSRSISKNKSLAQSPLSCCSPKKPKSVPGNPNLLAFAILLLSNGHVTSTQKESRPKSLEEEQSRAGEDNEKTVVWGFEQLGMDSAEVKEAMEEMGVFVPSEIQCVGIPRILEEKSLVLSSSSGSGRTLAYLLPLLQVEMFSHESDAARSTGYLCAATIENFEKINQTI